MPAYGHFEKYRCTLEAPIETHVLAGAGLSHDRSKADFSRCPYAERHDSKLTSTSQLISESGTLMLHDLIIS